ncbi:armadillo-type protein [Dissophora ornata]|nr:armadillo-type protein [Dissophora ornata]
MDESVLRNLLAALETIYNVASTNEARQQAQQYCEELKRDPSGPLYGYFLAHKDNQQPDVVRHFGLGLIENAVRYRWSDATFTPEIKAQIRLNVMSLAAEGSLPLLTERSFIKEKVARLFVEVAKREWPGAWDGMDAFLRQLFFKDETAREMALLILRSLCEDICVYDDAVAGLRKKDLRAGLIIIMSSETVLKEHYPDGVKGHKDEVTLMVGETGNDGWIARLAVLLQELLPRCQTETRAPADEKITIASLKTLASTLDWVIVSSVAAVPILPLICQALLSPSEKIRLAGAECYDVLSCRNLADAEREKIIWPLLEEGGIDLISKAYLTYAAQILQGEAYEFVQKTVQATVNLGEQQLCAKRSAYVPKELAKFLQLLYSMASHPSVLISSTVSFFWATLLRHETFSKESIVHTFIPSLLELYSGHLAKDFKNRYEADPVYRHFASIDFDSITEFRGYAEKTFARAVDVIHLGVPVVPLDAIIWVGNKVAGALKIEFTQEASVKDTVKFQAFDGTLTLMEVTISSLGDIIADRSHSQSAQVLDAMNSLLGILIEYDSKCLPALERAIASLSSFTDMFKLNSTQLFRCLDKLFKIVEYPMPTVTAREVRQLRGRAATTLVKIGRAIPDTLFPIYDEIDSAIQDLTKRNAIFQSEKRTLQSFLLVIGFNSGMPLDRRTIFEKAVQPVIADLQSPEIQHALSDPTKFMVFIGVVDLSDASKKALQEQEVDILKGVVTQRRSKLSGAIESLHVFMKETIDVKDAQKLELWTSYLSVILPNVFSTIRCLNATCDEKLWADLSPDMNRVLSLSLEEKEMMVTGKAPSSNSVPSTTGTVIKLISDLKIWLSVLRDQTYRVLAQMSLLGPAFYSIHSLQNILEQSLFENVDFLTNRQLRLLINHAVQPIVINCPKLFMDSVLSHLLMVLFPYMDQRLLKDWKLASDEGLVMDEKEDPEDMDVTDEIVKEVMLRDLTFYVAGFVYSILDYNKANHTAATTVLQQNQGATSAIVHKDIAPLALFIISRDAIAQSVVPLICHLITFKDTKSCMRATESALCVLTALVQSYPGSKAMLGAFSTMVLQAAMEAIHDPYHQEGQEKLIRLITEVYVEVRAFDEAPKVVFQQALGADAPRLEAFEQEISMTTNKTKKHALVRNFLQGIIGVAKSEWFKQKEQGDKHVSSRTIAGKYERPSQSILDSKDDEDIGEGLANMFDE